MLRSNLNILLVFIYKGTCQTLTQNLSTLCTWHKGFQLAGGVAQAIKVPA
jgi:hypothetical protein